MTAAQTCLAAEVAGLLGKRDEFMVVFERHLRG